MGKRITNRQMLGQKGVNLIEKRVLDMGYTWHPSNAPLEAGIDGWIELRDQVTGEVANIWLAVQSRARTNIDDTGDTISFGCSEDDLKYWLSGTSPVLLVVSRPQTNDAWWVSVKDFFRGKDSSKDKKVIFDKQKDRFDSNAAEQLRTLGQLNGSATYFTPRRGKKCLISNLIHISKWEDDIFFAPTTFTDERDVRNALGEHVEWPEYEWFLHNGFLYSFHCLAQEPWANVCDVSALDTFPTNNWAHSHSLDEHRLFVRLLNKCLRSIAGRLRMKYSKDKHCYYFKSNKDGRNRTLSYTSTKRKTSRDVVTIFTAEGSENKYYRHRAFEHSFKRFEDKWYLELTPTYFFTTGDDIPDAKGEEKLAKIKSLEGDAAVAGTVIMFADLLQDQCVSTLFREKYRFLSFADIDTVNIDACIDDEAWSTFKRPPKDNGSNTSNTDFGEGIFS